MATVDDYLSQRREAFEDELCQWLRIPSVSADSRRKNDVRAAADWLLKQFQGLGLKARLVETPGHPIVLAEWLEAPGAPTVLVYGHYDVQPPDPLDLWETPPFEPAKRNGNVYARGATDDKGQALTHVKGVEAWLKTVGRLPVNVKFLIEGEEEVGSRNLDDFIASHREALACDVVVISDTAQFAPGMPAITYGLKGLAYFELRLTGAQQDLHSGTFGGAVANPANALTRMLAALVDEKGRITVPGFYDDVVPLESDERREFASLPFDEPEFLRQLGVEALRGEHGYTTLERRWGRPTCDINGLTSGYQGEGAKTVLPSKASAKFSFRLVPKQDPVKIARSLEAMLRESCGPGIRMELEQFGGSAAVVVDRRSRYMQAAVKAVAHAFGREPVFIREGGSIPVVLTFREKLGVDTLLLGWGQNDDAPHAPNEKFSLADFHRGIAASARLWDELSRIKK